MYEILLNCGRCHADVSVLAETAILQVDIVSMGEAELLFRCPGCSAPDVKGIGADALCFLLLAGVAPTCIAEPRMDALDIPPDGPPFNWDDLLEWHDQLRSIRFVDPWIE